MTSCFVACRALHMQVSICGYRELDAAASYRLMRSLMNGLCEVCRSFGGRVRTCI